MKKLLSIFSLLGLLVSNVLPAYTYADTGDNPIIEGDNTAPMTQVINNNTEDSEEFEINGNNNELENIGNNWEWDIGNNWEWDIGNNWEWDIENNWEWDIGNNWEWDIGNNNLWTDNDSSIQNNLFEINSENLILDNTDMLVSNVNPVINEEEKKAVLLTWNIFVKRIKELANSNVPYWYSPDNNIEYIVKSEVDNNNAIIVSDPNKSDINIKAWYDNWTIYYYYTWAEKIYLNEDSSWLFGYLKALKSVDLSDFNTSEVKNIWYFFEWDENLESVDFSNFDTSNLEEMHYFMKGAKKLKSINLSWFVTNKVWHMNDLFEDCTDLETVIIDNWDLGGWSSLSNLWQWIFWNNPNLKYTSAKNWKNIPSNISYWVEQFFNQDAISWTLDVSNWDTSWVTDMSYTLYNMKNLTTIIWLDTWDTSSVTNMNSVFKWSAFKSLNLSWWDTSIVEDMYAMFEECENLEEIIWLDTRNTSKVKKMGCMFYKCKKLESLNIDNWDLRNLRGNSWNINFSEWWSSMFYQANNLTSISARNWKVPEDLYNWVSYWSIKNIPLEILDVSNWETSNVTKMNFMFTDLSSQVNIIWLDTWNTINVTNMAWMFTRSTWIRTLDLSNFDTSKVTNMNVMFSWASNLKTIYASDKFVVNNWTYSNDMFIGAESLVWWSWTTYDSNNITWAYAVIDDNYHSWYFTNILDREYNIYYDIDTQYLIWNLNNNEKYTPRNWTVQKRAVMPWYELEYWYESWHNEPFLITESTRWDKILYPKWKAIEEKAQETTSENVVYGNETTVTIWDDIHEEIIDNSSTINLVSKEVESNEVKAEDDKTTVQESEIKVSSDNKIEYQWWLEVYIEKTENNETKRLTWTALFWAPIAIKIPVTSNAETVKVQVKHYWEEFGYKWLTTNSVNECDYNWEAVNDKYNWGPISVTNINWEKYALIYTCSASTFVAYTENKKPVEPSPAAGGWRTINTTKQETKVVEQEHNSADTEKANEQESNKIVNQTTNTPTIEEKVKKIEWKSLTRWEVAVMTNILLEVYPQLVEGKTELDDVTRACTSYADEQNFTKDEKKAITRLCKLSIMWIHRDNNEPLDEFLVRQIATNWEFATVMDRVVANYTEKDLSVVKDAIKKLENDEEGVVFWTVYDVFMSIKNILS